MYFIGLLIATIFIVATMLLGGSPMLFVNAPSVMIVVGCSFALQVATHGNKSFAVFKFSVPDNLSDEERSSRSAEIKDFRTFLVVTGWIGLIIGAILMLANVRDTEVIGPGAAVALITVFYGYFLSYFVYYPLQRRLEG